MQSNCLKGFLNTIQKLKSESGELKFKIYQFVEDEKLERGVINQKELTVHGCQMASAVLPFEIEIEIFYKLIKFTYED